MLAAFTSGCSRRSDPALTAIVPNRVPAGSSASLTIRGDHLAPKVEVDFDSPSDSSRFADFTLSLSAGASQVALGEPTLVSAQEIQATLPATTPPGIYALELVDPRGRHAVLPAALTVYALTCAQDGDPCDDGDPCTLNETCHAGACGSGT